MLKNIKIGLIAFICLGSTFVAQAQKVIKEGTATYAVEYDLPAAQQSMAAMLPKEFKVQFKGDYSKFTTEKKLISGYNCTKYLLKDKISGNEMEVWATMDIVIPTNTLTASIKNVKGVPVEFSSNARGMKSKMTLKSVSEQPVPDIKLDIPTGYETMTFEDLMSQMGG